jgi:hypothetical protein
MIPSAYWKAMAISPDGLRIYNSIETQPRESSHPLMRENTR